MRNYHFLFQIQSSEPCENKDGLEMPETPQCQWPRQEWSPHLLMLSPVLSSHPLRFLCYIKLWPAWNPFPRVHGVARHCGNVENCVVLKVESMLVKLFLSHWTIVSSRHANLPQEKILIPALEFSVHFALEDLTKCLFLSEEFET